MPFKMGIGEIVLILGIILIVFGVGKLPEAFVSIGKAVHAFKRAESGEDDEEDESPGAEEEVKSKREEEKKAG